MSGSQEVTFSGKAEELPGIKLHVMLKSMLDSDLEDDATKAAYLASCFRGKALDWFARTYASNTQILSDYDTLIALVDEVFGLPTDVTQAQAQAKITHLHQTSGVAEYIAEFESLADQLGWPVSARQAFLYQGLKPALKDRLISENPVDYNALKTSARRVEALVQIAHPSGDASSPSGSSNKGRRKKAGLTCSKCGRKGHTAALCYAKAAQSRASVNMINVSGNE